MKKKPLVAMVYSNNFQRFKGEGVNSLQTRTNRDFRVGRGVLARARSLPMSQPVVRFRIPLGVEFSEKYYVFPL